MKKSLKYLLVSSLLANSLALSLPAFQSQATSSSESSTSQRSGFGETSEAWSGLEGYQFSPKPRSFDLSGSERLCRG